MGRKARLRGPARRDALFGLKKLKKKNPQHFDIAKVHLEDLQLKIWGTKRYRPSGNVGHEMNEI